MTLSIVIITIPRITKSAQNRLVKMSHICRWLFVQKNPLSDRTKSITYRKNAINFPNKFDTCSVIFRLTTNAKVIKGQYRCMAINNSMLSSICLNKREQVWHLKYNYLANCVKNKHLISYKLYYFVFELKLQANEMIIVGSYCY